MRMGGEAAMVYSYTQISQYLRCPRSYRYRYLDGWQEKDTRASMVFGRCFETALRAYFCEEDCGATLFREWDAYRDTAFEYKQGETWDRLLHQGIHLLERFAQNNRIRIPDPHQNLQIKKQRILTGSSELMVCAASLIGRRQPADTRKRRRACFRSILNSSAIRGSPGFPKQRWLSLYESMLLKSST